MAEHNEGGRILGEALHTINKFTNEAEELPAMSESAMTFIHAPGTATEDVRSERSLRIRPPDSLPLDSGRATTGHAQRLTALRFESSLCPGTCPEKAEKQ
jgi:hypothetical protein